jgi:hypothetical protein
MNRTQSLRCLIVACLLPLCGLCGARAENQTVLLLENIGLKNLYRVVFHEWNVENRFASGVVEVIPQDEDSSTTPSLRIPFRADIKADPKNKGVEILEVSSTALVAFFPPEKRKDPFPSMNWKMTGRTGANPVLKAKLWSFGKSAWESVEMEFVKPKQ